MKTFEEYQINAVATRFSLNKFLETYPETDDFIKRLLSILYDGLGLGESGEVQGKIKKIIRDGGGVISDDNIIEIKKELGDLLWYIASMCDNLGLKLEDVAAYNIEKLKSRKDRGVLHGNGDNR